MDELFLLPSTPVAMPRAYWLPRTGGDVLSSQLVLIQPSEFEFNRVMTAMQNSSVEEYDMEIVNTAYATSAFVLPQRPYNLLTGEFRAESHTSYLGNDVEVWDPEKILKEAKFLHFSDWPTPKPWLASNQTLDANAPKCHEADDGGEPDCRDRYIWQGFYYDFMNRRKVGHCL